MRPRNPAVRLVEHTSCCVCTGATTRGQTAHHICGGSIPTSPHENVVAAAHHIGTRVLAHQSLSYDEIAWRLRPELVGALDAALTLLLEGDRIRRDGELYTLTRPRRTRASRRPEQLDLFTEEPPQR